MWQFLSSLTIFKETINQGNKHQKKTANAVFFIGCVVDNQSNFE